MSSFSPPGIITINSDGDQIYRIDENQNDNLCDISIRHCCAPDAVVQFDERSSPLKNFLNCKSCNMRVALASSVLSWSKLKDYMDCIFRHI